MAGRSLPKQPVAGRLGAKRRSARSQTAAMKRARTAPMALQGPARTLAHPRSIALRDDEARQELLELLEHVSALERFSIAEFRERYEVSRERLSLAAQLPYQTILRWEKSTSVPRLSSFRAFAEALLAG